MARRPPDHDAVIAAPFGRIGIRLQDSRLVSVDFLDEKTPLRKPTTRPAASICRELVRYLANPRHRFRLELSTGGTAFQRRVWDALRRIPPGQVRSYGDLARQLHSGARAVGNACRANPIPIIIPCHRVVAQAGLGGFMGRSQGGALRLKEWLLAHEHRG